MKSRPDLQYDLDLRIEHLHRVRAANWICRKSHCWSTTGEVRLDWGPRCVTWIAIEELCPVQHRSLSSSIFSIANSGLPHAAAGTGWLCRVSICLHGRRCRWRRSNAGGLPRETRRGMLAPYDSWSHRRAIYDFVEGHSHSAQSANVAAAGRQSSKGLARLRDYPGEVDLGYARLVFSTRVPAEVAGIDSARGGMRTGIRPDTTSSRTSRERVIRRSESQFLARVIA